jgi:tetratricopeptide (TPR) repeat protein
MHAPSSETSGRGITPRAGVPSGGVRRVPRLPAFLKHPPASQFLQNDYQVYETWNNCGPASLSMALSYFGVHESQAVLGQDLRPYQNAYGDNDDKDVTWEELASEARKFGLLAYYRPDGNMTMLKRFLAIGVPVIAETVMTKDDDIGHYRVVKGYDDRAGTITQDDSMQGHNIQFSVADFRYMWKKYNYEYLVLVPRAKQRLAEAILGRDLNPGTAWQDTVRMDRAALAVDPADVTSRFNLSVALYYAGQYRHSVQQFEMVRNQLPARTLWYQIEPIEAYYALGDYQQVFSISAEILNNGDRAFSQLYILRGNIDRKEGNIQAARAEYENAVYYNKNLKAAQDALRSAS